MTSEQRNEGITETPLVNGSSRSTSTSPGASSRDLTHKALLEAARVVIADLKSVPEFQSTYLGIIGGLALIHHLGNVRETKDIDFVTTVESIDGKPTRVLNALLAISTSRYKATNSKFGLVYCAPDGKELDVDFVPADSKPFSPESVPPLIDLNDDELPYVNPLELMMFKVCCRRDPKKGDEKPRLDARDVDWIVEFAGVNNLTFSATQAKVVEEWLDPDFRNYGTTSEAQWARMLG